MARDRRHEDPLVHGYASVDHDIAWNVVSIDLPMLVTALEDALRDA